MVIVRETQYTLILYSIAQAYAKVTLRGVSCSHSNASARTSFARLAL
jgi:hypothetical protein